MRGIYKFFHSNQQITEGIFIEDSVNVNAILGKTVDDIFIDIGTITLVTDDETAVKYFDLYNMETGYNPFNYYES